MKAHLLQVKTWLLTGVSHAIPFIACGGILIAISIAFAPMSAAGPDFSNAPTLRLIHEIGNASFALMFPVLAGYIAYAMAGKPGLVPGFVGGYLAGAVDAGFLGALVAGLLAGYFVMTIKKLPVPKFIRPIMPILIIPIVSSFIVGGLMLKVIGLPIAEFMQMLAAWLSAMSTGNAVVLAAILGAMIAFDMGGPVNKTAFFFGSAMIKEGNYLIMGAVAAAICTPSLGVGLATILRKNLWSPEERDAGMASLAMGCIGITEGAIPFAAANPVRILPCTMAGAMVAASIAMLGRVGGHAPHGGPIVLPVIDHRLMYVVAIVVGTLVTAFACNFLRAKQPASPANNSNSP